MSLFVSALGPAMNAFLEYREALGFSRKSHESNFLNFDRFCAADYPDKDTLTREMVFEWLDGQCRGIVQKASNIRLGHAQRKSIQQKMKHQ